MVDGRVLTCGYRLISYLCLCVEGCVHSTCQVARRAVWARGATSGATTTCTLRTTPVAARHTGPVRIGIAGGAGAGKTTLAARVADHLCAELLHTDDYLLPPDLQPQIVGVDGQSWPDLNHPDSFDVERLASRLTAVADAEVLVIEGHVALALEPVRALLDLSFWLDTPDDVRLARKVLRKWHADQASVGPALVGYLQTARDAHQRFIEPTSQYASHVLDGLISSESLADHVCRLLDGEPPSAD